MLFWSIAIGLTAIVCATLYYAPARQRVNAADTDSSATEAHFRQLLEGIAAERANGRLSESEADAAKAELAREVLRHRSEQTGPEPGTRLSSAWVLSGCVVTAALGLGLYALLGQPGAPDTPLAARPQVAEQQVDIDSAISQIEARLAEVPEDVRGWQVLAPVYMQRGWFDDAANAYRQVLQLSEPDAEMRTDLAEAIILANDGNASDEAMTLLADAIAEDADNVRARFYLAGALLRRQDYDNAKAEWQALIERAEGDEPWLAAAREGLAVAESGGEAVPQTSQDTVTQEQIAGMVSGLAERLEEQGGTIDDWTRLVRSYLVLGNTDEAQEAYQQATRAYPEPQARQELDALIEDAGLSVGGAQ
ncbi:cytochrome c-type biogenesis protein CycH [Devosia pacifica]|uniref:Cytochrome c-type biogenesis protein CycH n=1 Tax=Devosia pacifica TaxID=1335967 RepID=A0A918VW77_9HYPH|nr:c-type cytochrome biogenesis protein CcmI [Devosia pacifica]GHA29205.1 cytochrome c-type biogenesis protein CycH [Devosia pacifica]